MSCCSFVIVPSAALGAVNIGVPFITFVVAIAAMFPMGGATVVAIRMGGEIKTVQIMLL